MFLIFSGFAGLHRFYLRSLLGVLFIPVFLGIIYTNGLLSDAREDVSRTRSDWESAELVVKRAEPQPSQASDAAALAKAKADLEPKSTRLNPVTNAHLVCRLLPDKKKKTH